MIRLQVPEEIPQQIHPDDPETQNKNQLKDNQMSKKPPHPKVPLINLTNPMVG